MLDENKPLAGKVAIITGAGQPVSIGRSHAMAFAKAGAKVVVNDNGSALDGADTGTNLADIVVEEIRHEGGEAVASMESVATGEGANAIVQTALDAFGKVDILVNNAGNQRFARIYEATDEDFDSLVAVHLKGTFNMMRAVSKPMMDQRYGVILNTASTGGLGFYGNSAVKEGTVGFTRSVARDLGPHGIRVNAIRPGAVSRMRADPKASAMANEAELVHGFPTAWNQFIVKDMVTSLNEAPETDLDPRHIANFVLWLCSDAAANVNGHTFRVAGGEIGLMTDPEMIRSVFRAGGWDFKSLNRPQVRGYLVGHLQNRFAGKGQ
jgi:NAD(P)-dependent dehydrogenase (short-subunit alcohol dehydrogenase family)